ncbi:MULTISPECIES: sugar phosphate isomerase/epimerase family protein [Micromonospora]|uniref:Sugar phosphate isomerase/epimerase n=1 Tax=Micromonospora yangpuensis TaxID=683228 RepID=A0A1C6VB05_9ACTN|nr:sugar phosphate isomerase/epimerase [Micromonospora yangpuensis]GGM22344.1 sugar phosphate isomerase [Micromonospora yangpuensis]SCL63060.1 Sugar phosphate isomerase/epimerase [Micromonospora yangpuensis]
MPDQPAHDPFTTTPDGRLSRRRLLAASAGAAAAIGAVGLPVLGTAAPALGAAKGSDPDAGSSGLRAAPLIPPTNRGIILYSVRDRISAAPDDSGVPYGFERVLARLAEIGYKEIEFAGFNQSTEILGRQITPAEIRKILDDNGLVANGCHTSINATSFQQQLDIAETLGMKNIGTGSAPTNSAYKADWDAAADVWNELGRQAKARGMRLYTHNHDAEYSFLLDAGPRDSSGRQTRSSGIRRLEYFFGQTDPRYVFFELDIYWAYVARFKHTKFINANGVEKTSLFDPILNVADRTKRFPLFHAKDGDRRTDLANGYEMTPLGDGDINFQQFFQTIGERHFHHANWEMDTAPGGTENRGQSLDFAAKSYENMADLSIYLQK